VTERGTSSGPISAVSPFERLAEIPGEQDPRAKRHTIREEIFVDDESVEDYEIRRPNTEGWRESPSA